MGNHPLWQKGEVAVHHLMRDLMHECVGAVVVVLEPLLAATLEAEAGEGDHEHLRRAHVHSAGVVRTARIAVILTRLVLVALLDPGLLAQTHQDFLLANPAYANLLRRLSPVLPA